MDARAALLDYHERSKHRLDRYAPGPGGLDWASQPNPFREFEGAPRLALPLAADALATPYDDVRAGRLPPARAFDLESVAILFELALGLSAWKAYGATRWALRCNPSSGNLHPTEGYLLCPALAGIAAGVHHYVSREHALEHRAAIDDARWAECFGERGIAVALSSIHWREAWKYGMRAWRYCQHDCGHAIAALSYAAAALGWQTRHLDSGDDDLAALLGLDRAADFADAEDEAPDVLLWIGDPATPPAATRLREALHAARWRGQANRLSASHVEWPDIESVHRATLKMGTVPDFRAREKMGTVPDFQAGVRSRGQRKSGTVPTFSDLARQRRSAVDFDGVTSIPDAAFFAMLESLLPDAATPPWNAAAGPALVHPAFMVHRVEGLDPGLYVMARDPDARDELKAAMRPEWLWQKAGPEQVPLYLLMPHDLRQAAKAICCHQDIAADSCFALGMLARFDAALAAPWRYRALFWECGMLGQALYLEAEAAGIRATGIGCFFDDEMHRLLGIHGHAWQSLYHFTAGGPVDDRRLSTLPPYHQRRSS